MTRIIKLTLAVILSTVLGSLSGLSLAAEPKAGRDYTIINPPLESTKGKIEVIEFFSYACPHCKDFNPLVEKWSATLPKDVSFRRVPVTFNKAVWTRLSKIFYALETTGDLAKLDGAVFRAIHDERANWATDDAAVAWAVSKGVDGKKFRDALGSFSMQSRVQRADQDAAAARIPGVPAIVVDGKFLLGAADGYEALLKLTDAVIVKARQERKGK